MFSSQENFFCYWAYFLFCSTLVQIRLSQLFRFVTKYSFSNARHEQLASSKLASSKWPAVPNRSHSIGSTATIRVCIHTYFLACFFSRSTVSRVKPKFAQERKFKQNLRQIHSHVSGLFLDLNLTISFCSHYGNLWVDCETN